MRCWTLPPVTLVAGGLDAVARAQLVDVVGVVMPVANTLAVSRAAAVPDEVMRRRRGHWAAGVREQREKTRSTFQKLTAVNCHYRSLDVMKN